MKRSAPLQRRTPLGPGEKSLERGSTFASRGEGLRRRKSLRSRQPRRDWSLARRKVMAEGVCRSCGSSRELEAAHVIGRDRDAFHLDGELRASSVWLVEPARVIVLCSACHRRYDGQAQPPLDVLPLLTLEEQVQAVRDAGGIVSAYRRTTGDRDLAGGMA